MSLTLTELVQNRDESAPGLQVLGSQPIQRDEKERLLLKAATGQNIQSLQNKKDLSHQKLNK